MQLNSAGDRLHPQLPPQRFEVGRHRSVLHLSVEVFERAGADSPVSRLEHALGRPVGNDAAAFAIDGAQGILKAKLVVCATADLNVGLQAEQRTAPVSAAPRVGVVEPAVARLRQALGHRSHLFRPHVLDSPIPHLRTRNSLNVGGDPLR